MERWTKRKSIRRALVGAAAWRDKDNRKERMSKNGTQAGWWGDMELQYEKGQMM
jgi:hypothetical protein